MPPPFARLPVAVANTHAKEHDRHGSRCRVIVRPDPTGDNHEVYRVSEGETLENAMQRVLTKMAA